jgi:uroporphyrinogen-III synthase
MANIQKSTGPRILITQNPTPDLEASYSSLKRFYKLDLHFEGLTEVTFIPSPKFRMHKPTICEHTTFLFTNKVAMDAFFTLGKSCNITLPLTTKYFLANEKLQTYLQKYVEIKKRKVFHGERYLEDLFPVFPKHKNEKFLFPCSKLGRKSLKDFFAEKKYHYTEVEIYNSGSRNLSELAPESYDIIVFFSVFAIESFAKNFPNHDFGKTKIATLGSKTLQVAKGLGWNVTIPVPANGVFSIVQGLDNYLSSLSL